MTFPEDIPDRPHPEIEKSLAHKTDPKATPYSDIDLFKRGDANQDTKERIASKEYEELLKKVEDVGRISSPKEFSDLFNFLTIIENQNKNRLEILAKKVIQKELGLSQDIMDNITGKLLTQSPTEPPVITDFNDEEKKHEERKKREQEQQNRKKEEENQDSEREEDGENIEPDENDTPLGKLGLTREEANQLVGEIQIRKIMNSMMMGGGYKLFDVLKDFKAELDAIDRRLYPLYIELNPNASLLIWQAPPSDIGGRMPAGSVKLKFEDDKGEESQENPEQNQDNQQNRNRPQQQDQEGENEEAPKEEKKIPKVVKVEAKAINFAVLLHELAKGALEYLFAIRLANFSDNLRRAIVDVADDYAGEHFHKLLGPQIWKQFFYGIEIALEDYSEHNNIFGIENKREMLPLIINKIATMKANDFINLVDDMLNPGEAEKNRRTSPLERIKQIIHSINLDIKEFMDSQDGHRGEIDLGNPNIGGIEHAINDKKNDWINDLEGKINKPEQEEPSEPIEKDYTVMDKNQLSKELLNALEDENFELAAKLRDLINSK